MVSVCVHPTNDYMITAATDGTWAFYDVHAALCLTQVRRVGLGGCCCLVAGCMCSEPGVLRSGL